MSATAIDLAADPDPRVDTVRALHPAGARWSTAMRRLETAIYGSATASDGDPSAITRREPNPLASAAVPARAAVLVRLCGDGYPGEGAPVAVHLVPRDGAVDVGSACEGPWAGDAALDPWHVRIAASPWGVRVIDPGSHGGVWLRLHAAVRLRDGDQFRVGAQFLIYEASEGRIGARWRREDDCGRLRCCDAAGQTALAVAITRPLALGRDGADVAFDDDPFVSIRHAWVVPEDDGVRLDDARSANGTWLRLRDGDVVPPGSVLAIGAGIYRVAAAEA